MFFYQLYKWIEERLQYQRQRRRGRQETEVQSTKRIERPEHENHPGIDQEAKVYGYVGDTSSKRRKWSQNHPGKVGVVWPKIKEKAGCPR